jgi:hypothetical protein
MTQDLTRLDRVAHRFERIGRPPRSEPVELGAMVERLATYFAARVPKIANPVIVRSEQPEEALTVSGDAVLLEWVLEVLTKNAIDALGRPWAARWCMSVEPIPEGGARVRVADDGPGVPRAKRTKIFEAGYSTKERGWGIGLALARRIVEENHGGSLRCSPTHVRGRRSTLSCAHDITMARLALRSAPADTRRRLLIRDAHRHARPADAVARLNPAQREAVQHNEGPLFGARWRRFRQDARAHHAHCASHRRTRHSCGGDPLGDLHQQGRRGDARAHCAAAGR